MLDGCALQENWKSDDGGSGKSLTFCDPAARRWHQTWIDDRAQPLFIDGDFDGPSLLLAGKTGEGRTETHHRITWTPMPDGVRQERTRVVR